MSNRPLVIYHADEDGFGAVWALSKHLGTDLELCPSVYKPNIPDITGRDVYMVDICYDLAVMQRINEDANSLLVLDHHDKAKQMSAKLPCIKYTPDYSACVWAWKWFQCDTPVPWILEYVQDRDLWQWQFPDSKTINTYFMVLPDEFEAWDKAAAMTKDEMLEAAQYIKLTVDAYVRSAISNARFVEFGGFVIPKVNANYWSISDVLDVLAETRLKPGYKPGKRWSNFIADDDEEGENPKFALSWYRTADNGTKCSLRSTPSCVTGKAYNVRLLAMRNGGGGHDQAAGFYTR